MYVPALATTHCDAPADDEYDPSVHGTHVDALVAPTAALAEPAVHETHVELSDDAYCPATH